MPDLFNQPNQSAGASDKPIGVMAMTLKIKQFVEGEFPNILVEGEISGWKAPNSRGHVYFDLVEGSEAKLPCACFSGDYARLPAGITFRNGLKVVARGGLSVHPPFGKYQFAVRKMMPSGIGETDLKLRQLKEKLLGLGWFDPKRKRPLPPFPNRIGLVTSRAGAAVRDILQLLRERWPLAEIVLAPVPVQGDQAPPQIARAVVMLNQLHQSGKLPLSVILLGRGGGAADDLWAFNDERVAQAIFNSEVPIVSAVGHEIDVTIADLVADVRAKTPTEAASLATPDHMEILESVNETHQWMRELVKRRLELLRDQVASLSDRAAFRRPQERLREFERRLDQIRDRMSVSIRRTGQQLRNHVAAIVGRLESLSPLNILARGYSLTFSGSGDLLRDSQQVKAGDRIKSRLHSGQIISIVESTGGPP